jgi:hypothetical protein
MVLRTHATFAVARVVAARKSFPIARETSFNEAPGDIRILYETLSDNAAPVFWLRPSVARGAAPDLDAPYLLASGESAQLLGRLSITGAAFFGGVNATQANPLGRAAVNPKLDIVAINYYCSAGQLGGIAGRGGSDPKNRKYRELQEAHRHSVSAA